MLGGGVKGGGGGGAESQHFFQVSVFILNLTHLLFKIHGTLKGNRNGFDIAGVLHIGTFIKANQFKGKRKTVRYSGDSLNPVFDIGEFDCGLI